MAKVRFQLFLDESQRVALENIQHDSGTSMAEVIRRAIDNFLCEYRAGKSAPAKPDKTTERLLAVAGVCEGGPADLADKHDGYLYGTARK